MLARLREWLLAHALASGGQCTCWWLLFNLRCCTYIAACLPAHCCCGPNKHIIRLPFLPQVEFGVAAYRSVQTFGSGAAQAQLGNKVRRLGRDGRMQHLW